MRYCIHADTPIPVTDSTLPPLSVTQASSLVESLLPDGTTPNLLLAVVASRAYATASQLNAILNDCPEELDVLRMNYVALAIALD